MPKAYIDLDYRDVSKPIEACLGLFETGARQIAAPVRITTFLAGRGPYWDIPGALVPRAPVICRYWSSDLLPAERPAAGGKWTALTETARTGCWPSQRAQLASQLENLRQALGQSQTEPGSTWINCFASYAVLLSLYDDSQPWDEWVYREWTDDGGPAFPSSAIPCSKCTVIKGIESCSTSSWKRARWSGVAWTKSAISSRLIDAD